MVQRQKIVIGRLEAIKHKNNMSEIEKKTESEILYSDIINLPHHVSVRHPRMTMEARAAQFSSFAALTGHEDAIEETSAEHIQSVHNRNLVDPSECFDE